MLNLPSRTQYNYFILYSRKQPKEDYPRSEALDDSMSDDLESVMAELGRKWIFQIFYEFAVT